MTAIDGAELDALVDYWRCANYLTVAQIYLQANPLLREPLRAEHIKPRLLGHWGTSPGLSLVYVQLNRLIRQTSADVIYIAGPGHGGPALVANTYLEGSYSELFPEVTPDESGLVRLVRQFSTPGRHPEPRQRHDARLDSRGRRARVRARARVRRRLRPPRPAGRLRRGRRRGRDRAARGVVEGHPLPAPRARRRRAADPAPERLQDRRARRCSGARSDEEVAGLLRAEGYEPQIVAGDDPHEVHRRFAEVLEGCYARIREIQARRARSRRSRPRSSAGLARDRAAHAEGLDGSRRRRRRADPGDVPRPPGAALARAGGSRAPRAARDLAAQLRTGASLRRARPARPGARGTGAGGRQAHGCESRTRTGAGCCARSTCRRSTTTRSASRRRGRSWPSRRAGSAPCCATSTAGTRRASGSTARTRRPRTGCRTCSTPRTAASSRRSCRPTTTCLRTAASWRC